jgi:hypothetical protein
VAGSAGGVFWTRDGWPGVVVFAVVLLVVALGCALSLVTRRPRSPKTRLAGPVHSAGVRLNS